MSLLLNEEQQLLKDTAKEFVQKNAPISHFRELRDKEDKLGYSKKLWKDMVQLGWSGILIPEEYGGVDFGMVGLGCILEETGRKLVPSPLFSTALVGASLLAIAGNDKQKKEFLPKVAEGKLITAFALEESSRHDPLTIETYCKKEGDKLILNGKKNFVLDGHIADLLIVAARHSEVQSKKGGIGLYLVDPKEKGIKLSRMNMVDSRNACRVILKDVEINKEDQIGELEASGIIEEVLDRAQIGLSSEMLGSALEAFDLTLEYLKERNQFGKPIGSFQALQHRAAKMFSEIELTKSSVMGALNSVDENSNDRARFASLAKFKAGETLHLVSNEAIQMHGGVGVTDEFDIGLFLKRSRVTEQIFGSSNYHLERYANLSEY